jgi:uncharacterized protein DUF3857
MAPRRAVRRWNRDGIYSAIGELSMRALPFILICLSSASYSFGQIQKPIDIVWLPITDAERNMKTPAVEKDAGVEAIFWRVHVRDELLGSQELQRVLYHYVRLKVFDEKGKEKASTIDLPTGDRTQIVSVNGRTIKADGTELELKKDSVFERDVVRAGRSRYRVKSFAMPGVEPGAIVEYRWREIRSDPSVMYTRLQFQREYPVQKVTYFVYPLSQRYTSYQMFSTPFHCKPSPLKPEDDGYVSTTLENVPAFHEEPMMPGEPNVRPWLLLMYRENGKFPEPEKYWNNAGKEMYNDFLKRAIKPNDEIRQAAAAATEGVTAEEMKIGALIRYIRKNVRDLFSPKVAEAERSKILKEIRTRVRTSPEILKSGIATPNEMNTLFASMASCIGLEARPAWVADREDIVFNPALADRYFLQNVDMAIQLGGKWDLHDVSARLLPSNMVSWREEGMQALLSDPKKPIFIESPVSPPEASTEVRSAQFTLSEDGTLDGDIDQRYSGHAAVNRRLEMQNEEEPARLEAVKKQFTSVFPDTEVSNLRIENADDPERPLKLSCHLKIPGYAQRTGKRLLLQPLIFQRGVAPLFAAADRHYPVDFHYAWMEQDTVSIMLPTGFSLDNAGNPGPLNFGPPGSYQLKMSVKGGRELTVFRELVFGKGGSLGYEVKHYSALKGVFDEVHRRDDVTISLKQAPAAAGTQ